MNNNVKKEIEKIKIPKELHERSKLGVEKAKSERSKGQFKHSLVAAVMVSILGCGILFSPIGQAMIESFFEVTKFKKSSHNEELSFGYHIDNLGLYEKNTYGSLDELEKAFNIKLPFPEQLFLKEKNQEMLEYKASIDENGKFIAYDYQLSLPGRNYNIFATNKIEAEVKFSAETIDGYGIEKDIIINGIPAKLLGINEIDGYAVYIENEEWKVIITCFDRATNEEGLLDVKEEEIINIVKSIKW